MVKGILSGNGKQMRGPIPEGMWGFDANAMQYSFDEAKAKAALSFFDWAYQNGDDAAAKLDYVPLPASVKDLVRAEWKQITDANGAAIY